MVETEKVMAELEALGNEQTRKIFSNHGATGPMFGVKVGDMKKVLKGRKNNHELALALYETGNLDAMYLAGLMADKKKVTPEQLDHWAQNAHFYMVGEYPVAGLAAESPHGAACARKWIDSEQEYVRAVGWSTWSGVVSHQPDGAVDAEEISALLKRVEKDISGEANRVRYTMNGFVIAVGCYVEACSPEALAVAERIGKVSVDMGGTACKVPFAPDYINKVVGMGRLGQKRKNVRC